MPPFQQEAIPVAAKELNAGNLWTSDNSSKNRKWAFCSSIKTSEWWGGWWSKWQNRKNLSKSLNTPYKWAPRGQVARGREKLPPTAGISTDSFDISHFFIIYGDIIPTWFAFRKILTTAVCFPSVTPTFALDAVLHLASERQKLVPFHCAASRIIKFSGLIRGEALWPVFPSFPLEK